MKNSKRGHLDSLNAFTNRKLQKNARQIYTLIEFEKSRIVPKKPKGGTLWSRLYFCTFGSIKNLWFSARIEPTISCFS